VRAVREGRRLGGRRADAGGAERRRAASSSAVERRQLPAVRLSESGAIRIPRSVSSRTGRSRRQRARLRPLA
jgi:hypothetical protein